MPISDSLKYISLLLFCSACFIVSLLIFSSGLLLHREVLPYKTSCFHETPLDYSNNENHDYTSIIRNLPFDKQLCSPSNFKVVLIIIDALRYDFVEYQNESSSNEVLFYRNKLTVVHNIMKEKPRNSVLLKFIADPPTTTMQRIKGLTTGSFPTFIDIGSNFDSPEINEDNLVDILCDNGKKIVFLGDDTWMKLYPGRFIRSYPFDSFNVWDLDTVDNGIKENLFHELQRNDWNLLIAHFLGVDHCGHRYGSNHPEMERKLNEMNDILKNITDDIENRKDVILFVVGDHGMTANGDHGGDAENEITTAIFTYSPVYHLYERPLATRDSVNQVDIVPTLSLIFGLPVPFSNTGAIIFECLPIYIFNSVSSIATLIWKNVHQIMNYVKKYSLRNSHFLDRLKLIRKYYYNLETLVEGKPHDTPLLIQEYEFFVKSVLQICHEIWVQFNYWLIFNGLLLMGVSVLFSFCISNMQSKLLHVRKRFWISLYSGGIVMILSTFLVLLKPNFNVYVLSVFFVFSMFHMFWFLKNISIRVRSIFRFSRWNVCMYVIFVFILAIPFSNSYILEEPKQILVFFISSLWITVLISTRGVRSKGNAIKRIQNFCKSTLVINTLLLSLMYRVVLSYAKCREEEDAECKNEVATKADFKSFIVSVLSIICLLGFVRFAVIGKNNITKFITYTHVSNFCFILLLINKGSEFVSQNMSNSISYADKIPAILFIISVSIVCFILFDISKPKKSDAIFTEENSSHIVPELCVINLNLVYMSIFLCIICMTLLEQTYTFSAALLLVCPWYLTFIHMVSRNEGGIDTPHVISNNFVLLWFMSSIYWFYVTGHNASFSGIQWNAAFLVQKEIGNSTVIPGALVILNTFVAFLIHGLLLQVLVVFSLTGNYLSPKMLPIPLKIFDRITPKKFDVHKTADAMLSEGFAVMLKYFTCFAIRMFAIMVSVTLHSRHLMMWQVFAPKFIFEGIAFMAVTIPSSIIGFIFTMKICSRLRLSAGKAQ